MLLLFSIRVAEPPIGKELFILFIVRVFCERLSFCGVCRSFPFGFKGGMWDLY